MVFLTIGRVLYDKGYRELIDASYSINKKYQNIEFQWLGAIDEDYPEFVSENQIMEDQKKGLINYLGFKFNVIDYIKNADCIVLPSYHEGMSRTLMEALALGKPIITTNIPGCKETVDEGKNGFLCNPKDAISLEAAIEKFLHLSPENIKNMSIYSRQKAVQQFDVKHVIKVYDDIVSRSRK